MLGCTVSEMILLFSVFLVIMTVLMGAFNGKICVNVTFSPVIAVLGESRADTARGGWFENQEVTE